METEQRISYSSAVSKPAVAPLTTKSPVLAPKPVTNNKPRQNSSESKIGILITNRTLDEFLVVKEAIRPYRWNVLVAERQEGEDDNQMMYREIMDTLGSDMNKISHNIFGGGVKDIKIIKINKPLDTLPVRLSRKGKIEEYRVSTITHLLDNGINSDPKCFDEMLKYRCSRAFGRLREMRNKNKK